jgi:hypothetical protein
MGATGFVMIAKCQTVHGSARTRLATRALHLLWRSGSANARHPSSSPITTRNSPPKINGIRYHWRAGAYVGAPGAAGLKDVAMTVLAAGKS